MTFLPFYVPSRSLPRIVVAGGGYAGMAALVDIHRHCPGAELTLIDPGDHHCKITHLHEVFRPAPTPLAVSYAVLARRFGFRHLRAKLEIDEHHLLQWQTDRAVEIDGEILPFDYLLIAIGSAVAKVGSADNLLDLDDFGGDRLARTLARLNELGPDEPITVVGGGATGVQFLFELAHWLAARGKSNPMRVIDAGDRVLPQFTPALGEYVASRMIDRNIEWIGDTRFAGFENDNLRVENLTTGHSSRLSSGITFSFVGKRPSTPVGTNVFGQVVVASDTLTHLFSAGDCAAYRGIGSNAMTAQSAVRKGLLCARNILRHSGALKVLEPYVHRDLGYVISLGPRDAVGWLGLQANVVAGYPAVIVKDLIEAQHDLWLAGIDTYLI